MTFLIAHRCKQAPVEAVFLRPGFEVFFIARQNFPAMTQKTMRPNVIKLANVAVEPLRQFGHQHAGFRAVEKIKSTIPQRFISAPWHDPGNGLNFTESKRDVEIRQIRTHQAEFIRIHQRKVELAVGHHLQQIRCIQLVGFTP